MRRLSILAICLVACSAVSQDAANMLSFVSQRTHDDSFSVSGGYQSSYERDGVSYSIADCPSNCSVVVAGAGIIDVLVVAGGGAGGSANAGNGGGGGAGGLIYTQSFYVAAGTYSITVGAGGIYSLDPKAAGRNGNNSSAFGLTAVGGGCGGTYYAGPATNWPAWDASAGGSGGGGPQYGYTLYPLGGSGVGGQGNSGGARTGTSYAGGGGGGAGGGGGNASGGGTNPRGGVGGVGLLIDITATPSYFAGGGASSTHGSSAVGPSAGGNGGGGAGQYKGTPGVSGTVGTGGGGGGGGENTAGGSGGAGRVIIRWRN